MKLRERERTVTWFAAKLCCTRTNVYKLFNKQTIDVLLLWRICHVLEHNFFADLAKSYNYDKDGSNVSEKDTKL